MTGSLTHTYLLFSNWYVLITFVHQELGLEDTEMNQKHFCVNLSLQASRNHIKPELKSTGEP